MTKKDYTTLMSELFTEDNLKALSGFYLIVSGKDWDKSIYTQVKEYGITNLDSRFDFHDPENSLLKGKIHTYLRSQKKNQPTRTQHKRLKK